MDSSSETSVGIVLLKEIGEFEEFFGVAGEAREFGKDEPLDMAALHVCEHSLGLGIFLHRLAAHPGEVIDFAHVEALRLRVKFGAFKVMLGAVAVGLVLGGDANPNADWMARRKFGRNFHIRNVADADMEARNRISFFG